GLIAHEGAVVVEIVDGLPSPERMLPDLEGLTEAVDVLSDAEFADAALGGRRAVALGVCAREEALGSVLALVWAEMDVVVRQHYRSASARCRSSGHVILKLRTGASTIRTSPPSASTSDASSVASATRSVSSARRRI